MSAPNASPATQLARACLLALASPLACASATAGESAATAFWVAPLLGVLLLVAAGLALAILRRQGSRVPPWLAAGLPACLAVSSLATLLAGLGGPAGAAPWSVLGLAAASLGLGLVASTLWPRQRRAAQAKTAAATTQAPWFARTLTPETPPRESEDQGISAAQSYRAIHDAAAEAILTTDAAGKILSANPAAEAMFAYRADEARGQSLADLVIDLNTITQGAEGGCPPTLSGRPCIATGRRKDGNTFAVELVSSRIVHPAGTRFITLLRDISERRRAEEALRKTNELFRAILEGTRESLFLMDRRGYLLAVNPTAAERLGKSAEELVGSLVFDHFPPEVTAQRKRVFFEVVERGEARQLEDSRAGRHFLVHYFPVIDADARVHSVSVFAQDITERKNAENELRKSEERYRNLLDHMEVGYLQTDLPTGLILAANPAMARMMGFSAPEDLIGQSTSRFYENPADRAEMIRALKEQGILRSYPIKVVGADRRRVPVEFHIRLIPASGDGPAVLEALAIDVRARIEAEARLREADRQIRDMTDELPCVVFQYRSDREARGRFSFVGGHVREIDRVTPEAILADPGLLLRNILPADRHAHIASLKRSACSLENWRSDFRVRSNDGHLRWLHAAAVLHESSSGEVVWNGYWLDITDRKLAEQALAESRNLLQGILDGTAETLVLLDDQGSILAANTTAASRVGETPASIKGRSFFSFFPPEISIARRAAFDQAVSTGRAQSLEDGRQGRAFSLNFYPILDDREGVQSVVLFALDVTQAKQTEVNLRESERKYREVFEKLQVGYFKLSVDGRIETVNPRAAQLLGYASAEDLCRCQAADIYFDLADRDALKRALQRNGRVTNYPMTLRRKDGTALHILANSEFLVDPSGRATHLETSVQDVSVLRELEARLRESEARFRKNLFGLPIEICICDVKGRVEYANQQYLATIGYTAGEAPTLADWWAQAAPDPVYRAEISGRWRAATQAVADSDTPATLPQAHLRCKDGIDRVFDIVARRLGEQYLVVFSNVTAREEAARELQRAKEAAEHAALARAQFLATMSHEIRTPLNGIIGMTELAIATATDDEQRRYLQIARSSADSLLGLLNAVLDFSKIEAGRLHAEKIAFDLRESVGEVLALLRPQAERKGLALHAHIDERIPGRLLSDPMRIRQILTNLLANAVKFTERGQIGLNITMESEAAGRITLHCQVSDTGIGIPPDRLQDIFAAFMQADGSITRRYGGTGLGLAICSRLAEMMGGQIWAESKLGEGSIFHCTLQAELP